MIGIFSSAVSRTAACVNGRRGYVIAGVCLLVAAGALRFYNLPGAALRYDEVLVTLISRGGLSEIVDNTRNIHTAPILYPIALGAVQKVEGSELGIRILPAAASLLTVGALLFWMPRVGVARWAAFMAALLCALSAAAIEHAQDAREYSVDALAAVMMIAGALQYLRDGGKRLLCGALLVAPLLQYGLALFGVAALGAAAVGAASWRMRVPQEGLAPHRRIWEWIRRRIDLALPIGCFGAACAASWELTAKYRYFGEFGGSWDSQPSKAGFYYQGGYDAADVAEFAVSRTWGMLSYHMPPSIAAGAVIVFGALLLLSLRRRRMDAVGLLALLAVGVAVCAALIDAYPFGGSRHGFYLGPIVFLAAGGAFHSVGVEVGGLLRRGWLAPALGAAAAVAIAVAGAAAVCQYRHYLYYSDPSVKQILAALDAREQAGDAVYVSRWEVPAVRFYKGERPANYYYGDAVCWGPSWAACAPEMLDEMFGAVGDARRIWLIHNASVSVAEALAAHSAGAAVEEVAANGRDGLIYPQAPSLPTPHYDRQVDRRLKRHNHNSWPRPHSTLHLITGFEESASKVGGENIGAYESAASVRASGAAVGAVGGSGGG